MREGWTNAKRGQPCPICQRSDWCSFTEDALVVACRRVADGGHERTDRSGGVYWLHRLDGALPYVGEPPPPAAPCAEPAVLDRAYRLLLGELQLDLHHVEALRTRGFYQDEIRARAYRTLPAEGHARIASRIIGRMGLEQSVGVPGIVWQEHADRSFPTIASAPGLVIPVLDAQRRVVGLRVRLDDAQEGGRYRWLSSAPHGGPGPSTSVHVPLDVHSGAPWRAARVRIVEGELKADLASSIISIRTISVAGVTNWPASIPVLHQLGAGVAVLAFDNDSRTNWRVAAALAAFADDLRGRGLRVELEVWDEAYKGIDDALLAGVEPQVLAGRRASDELQEIFLGAHRARPRRAAGG